MEALASGIPAVVSSLGGPKFVIKPNHSGFVATSADDYAASIWTLWHDGELLRVMSRNARQRALQFSWPGVFEKVHQNYADAFARELAEKALPTEALAP